MIPNIDQFIVCYAHDISVVMDLIKQRPLNGSAINFVEQKLQIHESQQRIDFE